MSKDVRGRQPRPSRHPAAIRAALPEDHRDQFDRAYRAAVGRAAVAENPNAITDTLEHWWRIAVLTADPDAHQRMLDTAAAIRAGIPVPLVSWTDVRARLDL